jgi:hypothetical protein
MDRRTLLKIMGGMAALPALGKAIKGTGIKAIKAAGKVLPKVSGMPEWFTPLVNKIIKEGKDISPEVKRLEDTVNIKKLKDGDTTFTLTEKPIDGEITVTIDSPRNPNGQTVDLQYKKPKQDFDVETGKATNEPGEFQILETEPQWQRDQTLDLGERVTSIDKAAGDIEAAERAATGKIKNREKIKERRITKDQMENNPLDYIEKEYGPERNLGQYDIKSGGEPDFANGGIASFANGGKVKNKSKAEEPLSKYKSYSENELLSSLDAKMPNLQIEDDVYYGMPSSEYLPKREYFDLAKGGFVNTGLTKTVPPAKGPDSQGVETLFKRRYN